MKSPLIGCVLFVLAGCAGFKAGLARDTYLREETQTKGVGKPVAEVWAALKAHLTSKGYVVTNADAVLLSSTPEFKGETEKRVVPSEKNTTRHLEFGAQSLGAAATRIEITEFTVATNAEGKQLRLGQRQPELELEVLALLEPQRAAEIKVEAQRRYDAALNAK